MWAALAQVFKIRPGEGTRAILMATYLLLAVSTFIAGRIARDALFLSQFTNQDLAYMYISVAVMVPLPAYLYARVADRFRRDRLILVALTVIIVSMFIMRALLDTGQRWVLVLLYNYVEVFGTFLILQFWTLAGDLFSSREAKRLYPFIGAGAVIGSVVSGIAVSALVRLNGTENILGLQIALLLMCWAIVFRLGRMEEARLTEAIVNSQTPGREPGRFQVKSQVATVFASKHLKIIALMTVATFITVPIVDYQFKVLAKEAFTRDGVVDTDALSSFMGLFFVITGMIAAAMQLGLTSRLLERFGVVVSLLILPVALILGLTGMLVGVATAFACTVFTKGVENSFRYSIYDATVQVIYTPVPGNVRGRAKTFIDGIVKPVSGGIAGAAMVAIVGPMRLPITSLAVVAMVLALAWCVLILLIRREYVSELLATLRRRRLDFSEQSLSISDEATVQLLRRTMASDDAAEVRNAVELSRRVSGHDLTPDLVKLLAHPEADLRVRALDILSQTPNQALADEILARFEDPDEGVKAAAVCALCAVVGEPALRVVKELLSSPAPQVRGAAVTSLIRHGGLEGILMSAEHLKEMQVSPIDDVRLAAAHVLRDIGVKNFYQPVLALLRDPSPKVQNAAIGAAGAMMSPELIPTLVYKLAQHDTARAAAQALASYGEVVVDVLGKVLAQEREEPSLRRQVPRILERIESPRCLDVLMANLGVADPDTRREAARAAARLRDKLHARVDIARVRLLIDEEVREHYQNLAALDDLAPIGIESGRNLLRAAIEERLARSLDRVFLLLSIIYPLKSIELIHTNLGSAKNTIRANAVEVLDNLLDAEEKKRVLPLLDDGPRKRILEHGGELYPLARKAPEEWLAGYMVCRDPWLVAVALHMAADLKAVQFRPIAERHLRHADAIVRETALRTLAVIAPPAEILAHCHTIERERDRTVLRARDWVRDQAARALGAESSGALDGRLVPLDTLVFSDGASDEMISTVEKVLFLRSIDLFSQVPSEDLSQIALITDEMQAEEGEQVFQEGDPGDTMFFVIDGHVRIHSGDDEFAVLSTRQVFGELALLDNQPRSATATALSVLRLLRIQRDDFHEIIARKGEISQGVIKVLARRLRRTIDRRLSFSPMTNIDAGVR